MAHGRTRQRRLGIEPLERRTLLTVAAFDLAGLLPAGGGDGTAGFVVDGASGGSQSGFSVSGAGDVNGDGIDDVVVGARFGNPVSEGNTGEAYVVFGRDDGFPAVVDAATLDGTNGFVVHGVDIDDTLGDAVSDAGDINGDGIDDLLLGAPRVESGVFNNAGRTYVLFGRDDGFPAVVDLATLGASDGFTLSGFGASQHSGLPVSAAGDINGDGFDDLAVGSCCAVPHGVDRAGQSYVVFGDDDGHPANLNLGALDGSNGFAVNGIDEFDRAGQVAGAGDFNGDGIGDLIIGANEADPNGNNLAGESYLVFGTDTGFPRFIDLSSLNGTTGFMLAGVDPEDRSGWAADGAGDINGDGFDDVLIAAYGADRESDGEVGEVYVVFGGPGPFAASRQLSALDGDNDFVLEGVSPGDEAGRAVAGAGDVNRDGFDDLLVAAPASGNGSVWLVFGGDTDYPARVDLATLTGLEGVRFDGVAAGDQSGHRVRAAGDVNDDGFADIAIGAPQADVDPDDDSNDGAGRSYVVFGAAEFTRGRPDLLLTSFDVSPDHVLGGETTVTLTVENQGDGSAGRVIVRVLLSDDATIDPGDVPVVDVDVGVLAAGEAREVSVPLQLPVATLYQRAIRDDLPGGGVSTSVDVIAGIVDPDDLIAESDETNNPDRGFGVDRDDVTFFPWDVDASGGVETTDVIFVINRLGEVDAQADLDGSGMVTPTDAVAAINRLRGLINPTVFEPAAGATSRASREAAVDFLFAESYSLNADLFDESADSLTPIADAGRVSLRREPSRRQVIPAPRLHNATEDPKASNGGESADGIDAQGSPIGGLTPAARLMVLPSR